MKNRLIAITFMIIGMNLIFALQLDAQAPSKISYQAIIRNSNNQLIVNQSIGMQISIIQGSTEGIVIYTENHSTTTNSNGLVSLEIGSGITSDIFSTIDWSNGPYFIKTETDPTGGSNYSISGVNQLLSVPYALHSKTSEVYTGTISKSQINDFGNYIEFEKDSSVTNEIEMPQDANTGDMAYFDGTLWTKLVAADSNDMVLTFCNGRPKWTTDGTCPTEIGEYAFGGVVFYIFKPGDLGYVEGEEHGLVCSISDLSSGSAWGCKGADISGAEGSEIGTGAQNTIDILNDCSTTGIAADTCAGLSLNGYDDWYLPSIDELNRMFNLRTIINATATSNGGSGFSGTYYWSSTEWSLDYAHITEFFIGNSHVGSKENLNRVRPIRSF